jgi:hypothetical protein
MCLYFFNDVVFSYSFAPNNCRKNFPFVEPTPISDTEPVNSPEPVETVPTSRQDREQDTTVEFFRSKEDVLLDKSRETTKRKVLSAIVGGKAITEDHVIKEIQTH